MVLAVRDYPEVNARYDDDAGVVTRFAGMHLGLATQTDGGLMVPVIRHACDASVGRHQLTKAEKCLNVLVFTRIGIGIYPGNNPNAQKTTCPYLKSAKMAGTCRTPFCLAIRSR
jgi:hypothetical protein